MSKLFERWTIMKDNKGNHSYFYGDLSDYDEEDLVGYTEIDESECTADDLVELFGNVLEDNNRHSMTSLGNEVLYACRKTLNLTKEEETLFIRTFIEHFMSNHNL